MSRPLHVVCLVILLATCACIVQAGDSGFGQAAQPRFDSAVAKDGLLGASILTAEGETRFQLRRNTTLLARLPAEVIERIESRVLLLQGEVEGQPGSWAGFSVEDGLWSGLWFDGETLHLLDPASRLGDSAKTYPVDSHVVYGVDELELSGLAHDQVHVPMSPGLLRGLRQAAASKGEEEVLRELEFTVVTDTQFSDLWGDRRDLVVASRVNIVDSIYRPQVGVRMALIHLEHLSDNGSMTSTNASLLLSQFSTSMNSASAYPHIPHRGLTHLFTGRNLDGSTAGIAKLRSLCSRSTGYAVDQIRQENLATGMIVAHEMGHNFGASHDGAVPGPCSHETGAWLMDPNPFVGATRFSPCSLAIVRANAEAAACLLDAEAEPVFELWVSSFGQGTVTSDAPGIYSGIDCGTVCRATYAAESMVELTPTSHAGWQFSHWDGACSGSGPCTVVLDQFRNVIAFFTELPAGASLLTVGRSGQGVVSSTPAGINCGATCSASFATGTSVSLTATPTAGWQFSGWSGACSGSGACSVSMSAARSVAASFTEIPPTTFQLSVSRSGQGVVTSSPAGISCGATCSANFNSGTSVSLTATPTAGWQFSGWSGACSGSGACSVSMSAARSVTATFTALPPATYSLQVSVSGQGAVSSNPAGIDCGSACSASFAEGTTVRLSPRPVEGWQFFGWSGACSGSADCFLSLIGNRSASAEFRPQRIFSGGFEALSAAD